MKLLLIRHAAPAADARGRCYGKLDIGLSGEGERQAAEIVHSLVDVHVAAVVSSPARRAVDTARPLAEAFGVDVEIRDDLRELDFGELEGLTPAEIGERYPDSLAWTAAPGGVSFAGGESVLALYERAVRAVRELAAGHAGETVAVFSHAVTIRAALAYALAMPLDALFRIEQSHGGMSVVEWHDGAPYVRTVNAREL